MKCTPLSKGSDRVSSAGRACWVEWSVYVVSLMLESGLEKWRREGWCLHCGECFILSKMQRCCERSTSWRNECGNEWVRRRRVGSIAERVRTDRRMYERSYVWSLNEKSDKMRGMKEWVSLPFRSLICAERSGVIFVCVYFEALSSALQRDSIMLSRGCDSGGSVECSAFS